VCRESTVDELRLQLYESESLYALVADGVIREVGNGVTISTAVGGRPK
jgi:hypothetical protein